MFSEDPKVLREQAKKLIKRGNALLKEAERIEDEKTMHLLWGVKINYENSFKGKNKSIAYEVLKNLFGLILILWISYYIIFQNKWFKRGIDEFGVRIEKDLNEFTKDFSKEELSSKKSESLKKDTY